MAMIKLNHLDTNKTQALHQLTNQEMVATIGGDDTLDKIAGIGTDIISALNPPDVVAAPPTPAQQAAQISNGIVNSGIATNNQSLATALQIAGLIPPA